MSYLMSFNTAPSNRNQNQSRLPRSVPKIASFGQQLSITRDRSRVMSTGEGQVQIEKAKNLMNKTVPSTGESLSVVTNKIKTDYSLVSMDDVLKDLKVLELQQLESQRQLEAIKQVKRYKLEQRNGWNKRLSEIKFSNGELKEKVERARKVLSESSHMHSESRRTGQVFIGNLQHIDSRLKQVMESLRSLQAKRRKADSDMMAVRQAQNRITRTKVELEKRFSDLMVKRDVLNDDEKRITLSIQHENISIKQMADESGELRKLRSELELILTREQQTSIASKSRNDSLSNDIEDTNRCHMEASKLEQEELMRLKEAHDNKREDICKIRYEISKVSEDHKELWNHFVSIQPLSVNHPMSCDTISKFLSMKEAESASLELQVSEETALLHTFDIHRLDLNHEALTSNHILTENIIAAKAVYATASDLKNEVLRRKEDNHVVFMELDKKRSQLTMDKQYYSEKEKQFDEYSILLRDHREQQQLLINSRRQDVQQSVLEIQEQSRLLENLKNILNDEQAAMAGRRDELSMELSKNQVTLDKVNYQLQTLSDSNVTDDEIITEVDPITRDMVEQLQSLQEKIKETIKAHPCLHQLDYDSEISTDENVSTNLRELIKLGRQTKDRGLDNRMHERSGYEATFLENPYTILENSRQKKSKRESFDETHDATWVQHPGLDNTDPSLGHGRFNVLQSKDKHNAASALSGNRNELRVGEKCYGGKAAKITSTEPAQQSKVSRDTMRGHVDKQLSSNNIEGKKKSKRESFDETHDATWVQHSGLDNTDPSLSHGRFNVLQSKDKHNAASALSGNRNELCVGEKCYGGKAAKITSTEPAQQSKVSRDTMRGHVDKQLSSNNIEGKKKSKRESFDETHDATWVQHSGLDNTDPSLSHGRFNVLQSKDKHNAASALSRNRNELCVGEKCYGGKAAKITSTEPAQQSKVSRDTMRGHVDKQLSSNNIEGKKKSKRESFDETHDATWVQHSGLDNTDPSLSHGRFNVLQSKDKHNAASALSGNRNELRVGEKCYGGKAAKITSTEPAQQSKVSRDTTHGLVDKQWSSNNIEGKKKSKRESFDETHDATWVQHPGLDNTDPSLSHGRFNVLLSKDKHNAASALSGNRNELCVGEKCYGGKAAKITSTEPAQQSKVSRDTMRGHVDNQSTKDESYASFPGDGKKHSAHSLKPSGLAANVLRPKNPSSLEINRVKLHENNLDVFDCKNINAMSEKENMSVNEVIVKADTGKIPSQKDVINFRSNTQNGTVGMDRNEPAGGESEANVRRRKKITSAGKGRDCNDFAKDLGFM